MFDSRNPTRCDVPINHPMPSADVPSKRPPVKSTRRQVIKKDGSVPSRDPDFNLQNYYTAILLELRSAAETSPEKIHSKYPDYVKRLANLSGFGSFKANLLLQLAARTGLTSPEVGTCGGVWSMKLGTYKFLKRSQSETFDDDIPLSLEKAREMFDELLRYYQEDLGRHHMTADDLDAMLCEAYRFLCGRPKMDVLRVSLQGELQNIISIRKKNPKNSKDRNYFLSIYAGGYYKAQHHKYKDLSEVINFHYKGRNSPGGVGLDNWTERCGYVNEKTPEWALRMRKIDNENEPSDRKLHHFCSNIVVSTQAGIQSGGSGVEEDVECMSSDDEDECD